MFTKVFCWVKYMSVCMCMVEIYRTKKDKKCNEIWDPLKWELSMTIRQETHFIL